jgi:hypothetical protein
MIHLIYVPATPDQIRDMLEVYGDFIKLAVDVERNVLAGRGQLHADCEAVLLEDGSNNDFVWGADWYPLSQKLEYEAMLNIRPRLGNRSIYLQNPDLRDKIAEIVNRLLRGVLP